MKEDFTMLCDKCGKNNATTHIKQIINGVLTKTALCSDCAAKEGFSNLTGGSISDMLSSLFGDSSYAIGKEKKCPICGSTFSYIANGGKAGCPECYKTFYSELLPYLKRVHGTVKHIGKYPSATVANQTLTIDKLEALKEELKSLIAEEKFEEAAVIRDKIKAMEGNLNE